MMLGDSARRVDVMVLLLLLLSGTTGLVDAASVLGLGKVFTANMTGNVVFLGFAIAGARGFVWPPYVVALLAFALGAFAAGGLAKTLSRKRRRWLIFVACIESGLLAVAALISLASGPFEADAQSGSMMAMIALTAIAMGVRNATIRALKAPDLTTTVLTLTITGVAADLWTGRDQIPAAARRLTAVAAMLCGSILGAALVLHFGLSVPLFAAAGIILIATFALASEETPAAG